MAKKKINREPKPFDWAKLYGERKLATDDRFGTCHKCGGFVRIPELEAIDCNNCGWIARKGFCDRCYGNLELIGRPGFTSTCGRDDRECIPRGKGLSSTLPEPKAKAKNPRKRTK